MIHRRGNRGNRDRIVILCDLCYLCGAIGRLQDRGKLTLSGVVSPRRICTSVEYGS